MADVATLGIKFEAQPVSPEKLAGPVVSKAAQAAQQSPGAGPKLTGLAGAGEANGDDTQATEADGGGISTDSAAPISMVERIKGRVGSYVSAVLEALQQLNPSEVTDQANQFSRIQGEWQAQLRQRREELEAQYRTQREMLNEGGPADLDALGAVYGTTNIKKLRKLLDEQKDLVSGRFFLELRDEFDQLAESMGITHINKRAFFNRRQKELDAEQEETADENAKRPRFQRWASGANQLAGGGFAGAVAGTGAGALGLAASAAQAITSPGFASTGIGLAASVGRMDTDGVTRGFAHLASQLPVVGGLLGTLTHGMLGLSNAVNSTAENLAGFSGPLMMQLQSQDMRRLERDMERAQRFGPQLAQASEQRFAYEQRLQEAMDQFLPKILEINESLLGIASSLWEAFRPGLSIILDLLGLVADGIRKICDLFEKYVVSYLSEALKALGIISENTAPPLSGGDNFLDQLLNNQLSDEQEDVIPGAPPQAMPTFNN